MRFHLILFALLGALLCQSVNGFTLTSARPLALGDAYAGMGEDAASLFINPAGLARLTKLSLTSIYAQPLANASSTSFALILPDYFGGTVGFGYYASVVSGVIISAEVADHLQHQRIVNYTRKITPQLDLGGNLKYLAEGFSPDVSSGANAKGQGFVFDLGARYQVNRWWSVGLALQDLGGQIAYADSTAQTIKRNYLLGNTFKFPWNEALFNLDVSKLAGKPSLLHAGFEWWPVEFLALRLGAKQSVKSASETYTDLSGGIGLNVAGVTFDYALVRPGNAFANISHYFSLGYASPRPSRRATYEAVAIQKVKLLKFPDVPAGHWASKQIEQLTTAGQLSYYPDGTFRPDRPISRAEIIMLLVRGKAFPSPIEKRAVFSDVPLNFWAADYVQIASEQKLTLGYPDGTFKPRNSTTRAEGVAFLARFTGISTGEAGDLSKSPYSDLPTRHWSLRTVLAARKEAILEFVRGNAFLPNASLTRAELADILYRTRFAKEQLSRYIFE
ncbi:hypothetical protein A2625_06030 [candidate division WOR-1 bacterium RIFCSPHIGHO2_01_FULL_53_15]|uniref:SLH domain-containing protein n=1 Tax=candidate division WOR-1 bacterium RIFCSPHIGHO2_01_FULL_53_15 TaxID=1802564 RepID=A0A1F4Q1B8_UNCSA|nr:MAG: hypothetical protein A2625_06030 [candidate division WOR-1 bacterium RIFCSPHIGHO2_01_FULL_53_15]OGC13851.1 MAG: hypothetical protein A3D23_02190 [candidate division WOR-1 bacterium RIFCSPHIGHO2_02_FULL_53_26]